MTLSSKLDAILAQCREVNTGLSLFRKWCGNSYEWDALTDIERKRWSNFADMQDKQNRATITAIEALSAAKDLAYTTSAATEVITQRLQRIADEWERSGVDGVPKTNQLT